MKRCTKCGELKPRTEFYAEKACRDGLRGECKACFAARAKVWYGKNREKAIANAAAAEGESRTSSGDEAGPITAYPRAHEGSAPAANIRDQLRGVRLDAGAPRGHLRSVPRAAQGG